MVLAGSSKDLRTAAGPRNLTCLSWRALACASQPCPICLVRTHPEHCGIESNFARTPLDRDPTALNSSRSWPARADLSVLRDCFGQPTEARKPAERRTVCFSEISLRLLRARVRGKSSIPIARSYAPHCRCVSRKRLKFVIRLSRPESTSRFLRADHRRAPLTMR